MIGHPYAAELERWPALALVGNTRLVRIDALRDEFPALRREQVLVTRIAPMRSAEARSAWTRSTVTRPRSTAASNEASHSAHSPLATLNLDRRSAGVKRLAPSAM